MEGSNVLTCPCCNQPVEGATFLADESSQIITNGRRSVRMTSREFHLAKLLIDRFPLVVTKEAIYDLVFLHPNGDGPEIKIVDVIICKVRPLLAEVGLAIETAWGRGYRIVEAKTEDAAGIRDTSIRIRAPGSAVRWTPQYDEQLLELMRRKMRPTACASIMRLPYMAVERAYKRLQPQIAG